MAKPPTIPNFTDLYQHAIGDRHWLGPFLSGHLTVEFMLRKLVGQYDAKLTGLAQNMKHFQLIDINGQIGTITESQKDVLLSINQMRNRLAHQITYNPTLDEIRNIWTAAAGAFSDLTDGISQGIAEIDVEGNLNSLDSWVFSDLFIQIAYDLHHTYVDLGGDEEVF